MIYLTGCASDDVRAEAVRTGDIGLMRTPEMGNSLEGWPLWAADNGCYNQGERFRLDTYVRFLEQSKPYRDRCLFATAPDVVGDADATRWRSKDVLPWIRRLGYKPAFVAQDGFREAWADWDAFDVLFIGGTDTFKLGSAPLVLRAKQRGKWVHVGRVNSFRRLMKFAHLGADSADGTYLKFGPDVNLPKMIAWLDRLHRQPALLTEVACS